MTQYVHSVERAERGMPKFEYLTVNEMRSSRREKPFRVKALLTDETERVFFIAQTGGAADDGSA